MQSLGLGDFFVCFFGVCVGGFLLFFFLSAAKLVPPTISDSGPFFFTCSGSLRNGATHFITCRTFEQDAFPKSMLSWQLFMKHPPDLFQYRCFPSLNALSEHASSTRPKGYCYLLARLKSHRAWKGIDILFTTVSVKVFSYSLYVCISLPFFSSCFNCLFLPSSQAVFLSHWTQFPVAMKEVMHYAFKNYRQQ